MFLKISDTNAFLFSILLQNATGVKRTPLTVHNPYVKKMTLENAVVPETSNKTTGMTPYPTYDLTLKRKLDYSSTGKTLRNVNRVRLLSAQESRQQNKLFYDMLPDGMVVFYPARGTPTGPNGYLAPLLKALSEALLNKDSKWLELLKRLGVTTVLPIRDQNTGLAKKFLYAGGTKTMDIKGILYIFDSIAENNVSKCNKICTDLVREANNVFDVRISFGGNLAAYGVEMTSLDDKFLDEDVANLAMMCYEDAIIDHSFFSDQVLVCQYFQHCPSVTDLFSTLFGV